jgi:hypothetical protein
MKFYVGRSVLVIAWTPHFPVEWQYSTGKCNDDDEGADRV